MDFIHALWQFILGSSGGIPEQYQGSGILLFSVASTFWGVVAVISDRIYYAVKGRSLFSLSYSGSASVSLRLAFLWALGTGLVGLLGSAASILQLTRLACFSVALGWPLIMSRMIDSFEREEDRQTPEGDQ
jgi:hypothetical protein